MAFTPISNTVPQYSKNAGGAAAADYYLKFYADGTTTPINMATDSTGGTTLAKCQLDSLGYPTTDGSTIFIPHIDQDYKLALYTNATDADANTFGNAAWVVDNLDRVVVSTEIDSVANATINYDYVATMTAETSPVAGRVVKLEDYASGRKAGVMTFVTKSGTGTDDGGSVINHDSLAFRYEQIFDEYTVKKFNAVGNGSNDDSDAIQSCIDYVESLGGGDVVFDGDSDFRVTVTKGTNDKYGIQIGDSNIRLIGRKGASLRRLSSNISTLALSFPLLLIGVPDDNATQLSNIEVTGLEFKGEDTRHSTSGSSLMDGRQAIWLKNVDGCNIHHNKFSNIDSGAIYAQRPGQYDEENAQYYNTTKCYNIKVTDNDFIAASHSTNGRALIHALNLRVDNAIVSGNYYEWCDACVQTSTTYDDYDDVETDTYTDSNLAQVVKRVGKGVVVKGNTVYNSSEHCFYLDGMTTTCTGNTIIVDNATVCNTGQLQIRGRGVSITGNTFTGVAKAGNINTGSMDVTFSGNSIQSVGDQAGGILGIQSTSLTSYIDNRSDYFGSYKPMRNIVVTDNTIDQPDASQTDGIAIRIITDNSDANFPDGQMQNVIVKGNVINRAKKGILFFANMLRNGTIEGNIFNGKDFTEAGFTTGTTMNSLYALGVDDGLTTALQNVSFDNNKVYGFEYILYDDGGAGAAGTFSCPFGVRGNSFSYIKYWDTAAFAQPTWQTMFTNNVGNQFLDRTGWYSSQAIQNALSDGTSNSEKKTMIQLVSSSDVRIYYDDANGYKAL